jgi:hypothetical protein
LGFISNNFVVTGVPQLSASRSCVAVNGVMSVVCRIELGSRDSFENRCISILLDLAGIGGSEALVIPSTSFADECTTVRNSANDSCIAAGLVEVVNWLSFRKFRSAGLLQSLCGHCQRSKREIARATKRALKNQCDWTDLTTPPCERLRDPLCNTLLFDKMLAHRKVNYLAETQSHGSDTSSGHVTAADILMAVMVTPWLDAFRAESDFISRTIPSIVRYVQRVRREMRHLCKDPKRVINEDSLLFVEGYCGPKTLWVDHLILPLAQGNAVNFAHNAKAKRHQLKTETEQCGGVELSLINETAELLLTRIPWRDTADSVEAWGVRTSSALIDEHSELWQHMCLPAGREQRKRQQVVSLLEHALALLPAGGVAVEFCSGGGYVGIPLAYVRRDCTVLLTDMNAVSLQFARQRVEALGLRNVRFLRCELADVAAIMDGSTVSTEEASDLLQAFNLGLALHACGGATDTVLELCRRQGAACVVAPCCYGFLQHCTAAARTVKKRSDELLLEAGSPSLEETCTIGPEGGSRCSECCGEVTPVVATSTERVYPQSEEFRAQGWQPRWFSSLCRRADRTFWTHDARAAQHNTAGALAMRVVDTDRLLWLREAGYEVYAAFMRPKEASVKNHILVGRRK